MNTIAIVGAQWGDEGKGKITDLLGRHCDLVVRYQGGNNAGHTIIVGTKKIVLHLIPSGILHKKCLSVVGHGVVFDPQSFKEELKEIRDSGVEITPTNLLISNNATVITSYHKIIDRIRESDGSKKIGTTGKGIGPAYEDKVSRIALKLSDLSNKKELLKKLKESIREKACLFKNLYNCEFPTVEQEASRLYELGQHMAPFLGDTFSVIDKALKENKKILYEGAQGVLLDVDYGSYPYVTSSTTSAGGVYTGAGIPGKHLDEILGITKAYTTRVGEGPFPTELFDQLGETIQKVGQEFGATTGRKRRCGWLDLPLLKYSIKCSNLTSLALTKLDVLSNLPELRICIAYKYKGEQIDCAYPGIDLYNVEPIFKNFSPFNDTFTQKDDHLILSKNLNDYINFIESIIEIPIGIIAFGPERSQILFRKKYL